MSTAKYDPKNIEHKWYQTWSDAGYFKPSMDEAAAPFCIQLPPPNVTGTLHMGHAFNQTIMDGLTRYHRMKGCNTLWVPGTDHAGIATQIVVERQLSEQGIDRHELGREAFVEKIWAWKDISGGTITEQMRRVGCSVDWEHEYFTMSEDHSKVVLEVFVRLYNEGLIYRGKRLVNWDPVLGTAVSDLEVESTEEDGHMWHIRYPVVGSDEYVEIATTRPETLLGDVAVAVNPTDERYAHLVGKTLVLPLTGREIPVVTDDYVEADFGTGCVKITPAHDFNDYEVGKRHSTQLINIFDLEAKVLAKAEVCAFDGKALGSIDLPAAYAGLDRFAARKAIVADLTAQGLLVEVKAHKLMSPRGDRTGTVIEPMLTNQWFMAMSEVAKGDETGLSLAQKAIDVVQSGEVRFIPENWVNTYNQWMNNIQDWCISRQLWWGHQIPAWYDDEGKIYVAKTEAEAQAQAGAGVVLRQEEDVLDTWFSSAMVPFSSLGWPDDTAELRAFLPSNVLVTGYEIIFFWVARMIMMTKHFTGKVPFNDIYIHGMVRDHEGKKMSKSEGNVIDPVDLIDGVALPELLAKRTTGLRRPEHAPGIIKQTEKQFPDGIPAYGTDALRFTMASYASLGRSVNFDFKRCEGYRNFCNKLWNATRFVMMNVEDKDCGHDDSARPYSFVDQWILNSLQDTVAQVTEAMETYRFDLAAQAIYEFAWNEYCDWYVELAKVQLQSGDEAAARATRHTLLYVLETILRLIHPIMPFITEELWQTVAPLAKAKTTESIMMAPWPVVNQDLIFPDSMSQMVLFKDLVGSVRNLRGEMGLGPSVKAPLFIEGGQEFSSMLPYLSLLARLTEASLVSALPEDDAPVAVCAGARMMLKVEIDKAAEAARLGREEAKLVKELDRLQAKLGMPGYTEKAPPHLVVKDKALLADIEDKLSKIHAQLAKLK